jgi:CRISPR-associated endonuclease Csn1
MKKILGLDLGTNSIGWSLISHNFEKKEGKIDGLGVRIIPMDAGVLGKFDAGLSHSQTAERTGYRSKRRLYQRDNLRRERLHRVLNILGFLPSHYRESIDFDKKLGQFKPGKEVKLNYRETEQGNYQFIFTEAFQEMLAEFKTAQPDLFYLKNNGIETKIPYDWTLYYLRKKALSKPISKHELAWLILNFNQKRGYYQMRGEEADKDDDKEFVELKVDQLVDSGEQMKGKPLYNVIFENGWQFDKQILKTENWVGRTKEFIVTTKTLKNGDVKRTFKTVDSQEDWIAIKSKTEQNINESGKTVGEYIYNTLLINPTQKIRGKLIKTIERKLYKDELRRILFKQIEYNKQFFSNELYQACIKELYPRNEAHQYNIKDKDFLYLFIEDIIFYQRPLKSQKGTIAACPFEERYCKIENNETGKFENKKVPVKTMSKSHPLFQEFRIWQWLKNLKIYNKEVVEKGGLKDVTYQLLPDEDAWVRLFDFLNTKKELDQKQFIDHFVKLRLIDKREKDQFRWNYPEDKKYPFAETRAQLITRIAKVGGIKNPEDFLDEKTKLGKKQTSPSVSRLEQLWHIIYSVSDLKEYKKALKKYAKKHHLDEVSFVENFLKFQPFKSDYSNYSKKAINKLLPVMRIGNYWKENKISIEVKNRATAIMERVDHLNLNENYTSIDLIKALAQVSDDDIPRQLVKSFIPLKNKNPLKGLNTYQATYLVYGKYSEVGDILHWNDSFEITKYLRKFKQHSLRNPIVEQVVTETLRVVRDIWEFYGEKFNIDFTEVYDPIRKRNIKSYKSYFDEIHLELGREMKNPKGKREEISKQNTENENTNHRIKEILNELMTDPNIEGDVRSFSPSQQEMLKIFEEGIFLNPDADYSIVSLDEILKIRKSNAPSKKDIQRYRLWMDQGYISPYTGSPIQLSALFTNLYEIEHIIPQSRFFDNSLSNKVICETEVNTEKGNQTAYEFIKNKGGSIINGHRIFGLEEYESHVNKFFNKNKTKLKNLLSEDIPEGFINRQLNDSRYISKFIKSLLSNIVREEGEQEATSKNLIPVTGAVTSKLKQDWGLNDKWNEIIAPRFERLNKLSLSNNFGFWDQSINAFRIQVPDEISKGFNKKRIDHRHHALDALVVACTTRSHTHYLCALNAEKENYSLRDKLLIKNNQGKYTKHFQLPWEGFSIQAKSQLEKTVISFKQNLRVINKATNKFWSYTDENGKINFGKDGKPQKKLRVQTKGDNWAIRKAMHKETVSGLYNIDTPKNKIATAVRASLDEIKTEKHLEKITDKRIREVILPNHLKNYIDEKGKTNYSTAFSQEGIEDLNKNIATLNEGKKHQPIYKVKLYEVGSKFRISEDQSSAKHEKFVEAAKGTNLFFAVYWDEIKQRRNYETIPLNEVIAHQKQIAHLPKKERTPIQAKTELGRFLFSLSPNDLVYVPTDEELENLNTIDFNQLTKKQSSRIYKMVSSSGIQCFFIQNLVAKSIQNKFEFSALNKMEKSVNEIMIKERCIKLRVDRLGNITKAK